MNLIIIYLSIYLFSSIYLSLIYCRNFNYVLQKLSKKDDNKNNTKCYNTDCFNSIEIGSIWPMAKLYKFYPESPEKNNIKFYLFTCYNYLNPIILPYNITINDIKNIKNLNYDQTKRTIFIVHGYTDFYNQFNWMGNLKDHILKTKSCNLNVIIVDWSGGSIVKNYLQAVANTHLVGYFVAKFIEKLNQIFNTNNDHYTVIGHSLGGQIAGFVGKNLSDKKNKLRLIIGLDPAGPAFSDVSEKSRLNPNDANLVITIQTNGGKNVADGLGLLKPVGHYSFYPNGGSDQPGCEKARGITNILLRGISVGLTDTFACSHRRAYLLMAYNESMFDNYESLAYKCNNYTDYKEGKCGNCKHEDEGDDDCQRFGNWFDYWQERKRPSKKWTKPVMYFIETRGEIPYSYYHYQIVVKTSKKFKTIKAKLFLNIVGNLRKDYIVEAIIEKKFEPNNIYTHLLSLEKSIGKIKSIDMKLISNDNDTDNDNDIFIIIDYIKITYMNGFSYSFRKKLSSKLQPITKKDSKIFNNSSEFSRFG